MYNPGQQFTPLLERNGLRQASSKEAWLNVPELEAALLREWCWDVLSSKVHLLYRTEHDVDSLLIRQEGLALARALNIALPRACSIDHDAFWVWSARPDPVHLIMSSADEDTDVLLNIADYLVVSGLASDERVTELRSFLNFTHSAWQIAEGNRSISLRVPLELESLYRQAVESGGLPAVSLTKAWDAAWRRDSPNIDEAYLNGTKALEGALKPIVSPNNDVTTLGTIIKDLGAKPDKWTTRFRGVETVNILKDLVNEFWRTESRHAGMPPNTLEQSRDAVTVAVAIVALVERDFLTRVDRC